MRNIQVQGRATSNQIDVLWDSPDGANRDYRIVFEVRSYKTPSNKAPFMPSGQSSMTSRTKPDRFGHMVTTTGYQRGAQKVADAYDLIILEFATRGQGQGESGKQDRC